MKKLLALLLVLALVLGLAACGVPLPAIPGRTEGSSAAPADTKTPAPQTDTPRTDAPAPQTEPAPAEFQELTVLDNESCSMKITAVEEDNFWGFTLKTLLENKTEDKNLRFTVESASINGVCADPLFSAEVAAGKRANEDLTFYDDSLKELLKVFTDVELTVRVHDADDWFADDVAQETVHVYPYGEARAERYVREAQPTDTVLVENSELAFVVTAYDPESFWGYGVNVYLENKTDVPLRFSADEVAVNGFMCDPYWSVTVAPGKVAFSTMSWTDSSFEENGITEVEEIEFSLRIHNADDYLADNLLEQSFTLNPTP